MAQKNFNEEFTKIYENPSLLTKFDVEEKAHIEIDPVLGDAMLQAKKVREKMKDDFAEQDKAVEEFVKDQELEEEPKLPELQDEKPLKDMKLVESMLTESDLEPIKEELEEQLNPNLNLEQIRLNVEKYISDKLESFILDQMPAQDIALNVDGYDDDMCPEETTYESEKRFNRAMGYISKAATELAWGLMENAWMVPPYNESLEEEYNGRLTEAKLSDMIAAFKDKIEDLEDVSESLEEEASQESDAEPLTEDVPLDDLVDKYEEIMDKLGESVEDQADAKIEESVELTEDYSNFLGKPLKDFLKTLPSNEKVNIDYSETSRSGSSGIMGRVNQVPWDVADRLIKDIQIGDENYYKFKILTEDIEEDKKKEMTEARKVSKFSYDDDESHRYKIVAADADSKELFVKDVKGLGKVDKVIAELTDEKLNTMGATQLYVTRDDDKEVFLKFGNEDGSWDIIQDERDMEKPAEERDTLFNHIVADLNAESTPDQKALRLMPRKGEGYVGFENDEIGFDEDGDVFHLKSQSDKPINWAKKVAAFYGFKTSEVKIGQNNYKYIDIFAPGISKDPKLNP